jgi:hypothetical protein
MLMADVAQDAPATTRLNEAIGRLRISAVRARVNERTLLYVGGALGVIGLLVVWIGWWGAAHNVNLPEQIPYIISGGLFGLGLVFLGGFSYFAYWITRLVQEQQRQTEQLVAAIAALGGNPTTNGSAPAVASTAGASAAASGLVATAKGSMAHRADCAVVAGKSGLRKVTAKNDLDACRLCNPY